MSEKLKIKYTIYLKEQQKERTKEGRGKDFIEDSFKYKKKCVSPLKGFKSLKKAIKNPAHITTQVGLGGRGEGSKSFLEERKTKVGSYKKERSKMVPDFSTTIDIRR